jgi:putative AlgH/UPF0301 family transcriptional regulator
VENDAWLICDVPESFIFSNPEKQWENSLSFAGKRYEIWKNFPENPELN